MRSIRLKLMLSVGLMVLASLAAVGYTSMRFTHDAIFKFLEVEESAEAGAGNLGEEVDGVVTGLAWHHATTGSWEDAGPALRELALRAGSERSYLLLDDAGRLVAGSNDDLDRARVRTTPDGFHDISLSTGEAGAEEMSFRLKGTGIPVRDDGGRLIGSLLAVPLPDAGPAHDEVQILASMNRWLLGAVAVVGGLALLATAIIAGRILGPVEEITRAAREMERGRLDHKVKVSSGDEVGDLARAFNSMAEGLARIEELRKKMVSDVAHELRTPLTSIRCQLEAIQDGLVKPDAAALSSIQEEVLALQHLVEDLQDLALAEAGQLRLNPAVISVREETESVVRALTPPAAGGSARLVVAMDGLPPARADADRFRQVVRNLVSNAIKHTPAEGEIRIAGRRENGKIRVEVSDDGPGIPEEHLPYVFERFYRADPARERRTGGAGLGLAISRQLVEAQGGDIRAESRPEGGAAFIFTLPVADRS